jgi:delta14-sterol reductase
MFFTVINNNTSTYRGANMQKYAYRKHPESKTFLSGLINQTTVPGTRILCSGWWGAARHFNYFGEIIQAIALAMPSAILANSLHGKLFPFIYPLYYLLLFIPRQIDDDSLCAAKYGAKWDEYKRLVPYRIIPGIY